MSQPGLEAAPMSPTEARRIVSPIAANLRHESPDCRGMILVVRDLAVDIGRWNLLKPEKPGTRSQWLDERPSMIRMRLENLEAAPFGGECLEGRATSGTSAASLRGRAGVDI